MDTEIEETAYQRGFNAGEKRADEKTDEIFARYRKAIQELKVENQYLNEQIRSHSSSPKKKEETGFLAVYWGQSLLLNLDLTRLQSEMNLNFVLDMGGREITVEVMASHRSFTDSTPEHASSILRKHLRQHEELSNAPADSSDPFSSGTGETYERPFPDSMGIAPVGTPKE